MNSYQHNEIYTSKREEGSLVPDLGPRKVDAFCGLCRPGERSINSVLNQEVHSRDREDWSTREEFGSVRWTTACW